MMVLFGVVTAVSLGMANGEAREVTFPTTDGLELVGTFQPAKTEATAGAVLLLPGSGPTDRNGNQLPLVRTDLLQGIAEELAAQGWASFRFDKRATPRYASQFPSEINELSRFFSLDNHVADITAAYEAMSAALNDQELPRVIFGHSEGGIHAIVAAETLAPDALILAGTPGRPLREVIHEQITRLLENQGAPDSIKATFLNQNEAIMNQIIESGTLPESMLPGLRPLYNPTVGVFLQAMLPLDPAARLTTFPGRVLILQGEADIQISSERDAPRLYEAAGERGTLHVFEGASHNFKAVENPSTEPGFEGPIMPEVLTAIREFLQALQPES